MSKRGRPEEAIQKRRANAEDPERIKARFIGKVDKTSETGCWNWIAGRSGMKYGRFHMKGKSMMAHRASYILFVGPIADDLLALHSCDNHVCVQPLHLKPGTHEQNMQEAADRGLMQAPNRILSDADVFEIRSTFGGRDGEHHVMAEKYGVDHSTIANILRGHTYQHLYPQQPPKVAMQLSMFERADKTLSTKRPQGDTHHKAKMTRETVAAMRVESRLGATGVALAAKYGISKAQVSSILRGEFW